MAEVTNHMVSEKISHILENQSKKLSYLSQLNILFHKSIWSQTSSSNDPDFGTTTHLLISHWKALKYCLYDKEKNQNIRQKAKHNKIEVMRQSLSLRTKGLCSSQSVDIW